MKRLFIYKGLELEANINGYATYDLKIDKLTHQDLGQMQMYVNYYDRYVKQDFEKPTIGILLCKEKNDALVNLPCLRMLTSMLLLINSISPTRLYCKLR